MQLLQPPAQTKEAVSRYLGLAAFLIVFGAAIWQFNLGTASGQQQIIRQGPVPDPRNRLQANDQDAVAGVYLPTDRALSRAVTRARNASKPTNITRCCRSCRVFCLATKTLFWSGRLAIAPSSG